MSKVGEISAASAVRRFKPYPVYKNTGIEWLGEVPEHWEVNKISRYFIARKGSNAALLTSEYCGAIEGEHPVYSGQTENNGVMSLINQYEFDAGSDGYLFSTTVGAKAMSLMHLRGKFSLSQNCMVIISLTRDTVARFFYYHLQPAFSYERGLISEHMQASFRMEDLYQYRFALPLSKEQHAIAAFLDRETERIDQLIAKKERQIGLLQEKRSALISHAVTKGLNPKAKMKDSGIEWLGEIPEHWKVFRFKYLLTEPLKYGANEVAELDDPNLPRYVRITDVNDDGSLRDDTFKSLPEEIAKPYLLTEGDLLFARSGATVGKTFYYQKPWGRAAYAGYLIRARIAPKKMLSKFGAYFARSTNYWKWLKSSMIQATIQNVSAEKYAGLVLGVPPLGEQMQIVEYIDKETEKIDALSVILTDSIDKLLEYRTALISAAVTGKIDVREEAA